MTFLVQSFCTHKSLISKMSHQIIINVMEWPLDPTRAQKGYSSFNLVQFLFSEQVLFWIKIFFGARKGLEIELWNGYWMLKKTQVAIKSGCIPFGFIQKVSLGFTTSRALNGSSCDIFGVQKGLKNSRNQVAFSEQRFSLNLHFFCARKWLETSNH